MKIATVLKMTIPEVMSFDQDNVHTEFEHYKKDTEYAFYLLMDYISELQEKKERKKERKKIS